MIFNAVLPIFAPLLSYQLGLGDITPDVPLPLGGYTARNGALGVLGKEKLYVHVLMLNQGSEKVAVVSLDMLTVPQSLYSAVKERLGNSCQIFLCATHTHSAPDSQMLNDKMTLEVPGIAKFNRKWLNWYAEKISAAVKATMKIKPINVESYNIVTRIASCNRARRKLATPDRRFTTLFFGDETIFTHYSAHATILDEKSNIISGDWPGALMARTKGLFFPGAIGDVSPVADDGTSKQRILQMVDAMTSEKYIGSDGLQWNLDEPGIYLHYGINHFGWERLKYSYGPLFTQAEIALEKPVPHPTFAKEYKVSEGLASLAVNTFAPRKAEVTAWAMGPLAVVGIPGEPTSDVGREIEMIGRNLGFPRVLVVSHVNGWIGYILKPDDYGRGGYEATLSFHGPKTSERVKDAARVCLKQLISQRRKLTDEK